MRIAQSEEYQGDDWWKWSVWIEGADDELDAIAKVVWRLHPTFVDPLQTRTNRSDGFRLDTEGWGTFTIRADVVMKGDVDSPQTRRLSHELTLSYPATAPER